MVDPHALKSSDLDSPARHAFAITPHDTNQLAFATRGLWVGGSGKVKVDLQGGETGVTFEGIQTGTLLPISVVLVYATGTDATLLVGLY